MRWYLAIGAATGFCLWMALPIVTGLPVFILTHSGDQELHEIGHRLGESLDPVYYLWELPSVLGDRWAQMLGLTGDARELAGILVMYALPTLVGAIGGAAVHVLSRTRQAVLANDNDAG